MEHWEEIGFQVGRLAHLIHKGVDRSAFPQGGTEDDVALTGIQGRIIGYLYANRDRDVFQRDIQALLSVTRSTVTGNLQLMEKNGLITRQPVDWDARLKKLELTPKAMSMHESVIRGFVRMEESLSATLTPEEKQEFLRLCNKIRNGLESSASGAKE